MNNNILRIGDSIPDFSADTTIGPINFYDWTQGQWAVIFSHPADFTPVCTTELGRVAKLQEEFNKRNVRVIALSVDSMSSHNKWIPEIESTQNVSLTYPVIADEDGSIARLLGMIHPATSEKFTVRTVYVIGPDKKVKLSINYPASTGRNFSELLRVIDSLQLTANHSLATPVDWKQGEDCIVLPAITDQEAEEKFGEIERITPYLRYTKFPK